MWYRDGKNRMEQLYSEYPALYDAIQADWNYDRDVSFVLDLLEGQDPETCRLLDVGCGTGQHTRRFVDRGFDVTAIDPNDGMLQRARETVDARYFNAGIPGIPDVGRFDVVVAIRGVINHIPPENLEAAVADVARHLAPEGIFVFDNSPLPADGNQPAIDVGHVENGSYGRIVQMNPRGDNRLQWDQLVVTPDGDVFVDSCAMTPFDDIEIAAALAKNGLEFEYFDGFGPNDSRTVFACR